MVPWSIDREEMLLRSGLVSHFCWHIGLDVVRKHQTFQALHIAHRFLLDRQGCDVM